MGLAASQARLLLLTSRKSDLEYRAQMISQRKVMLAMQTEEIATKYSKALNDRKLFFMWTASSNKQETKTELLTYNNFTAAGNSTQYRLIDVNTNKIACLDLSEASKYVNKADFMVSTPVYNGNEVAKNDDGTEKTTEVLNEAAYKAAIEKMKESMVVVPGLQNPDYLQDAMQSGLLLIQAKTVEYRNITDENGNLQEDEATGNVKQEPVVTWKNTVLSGMDDVASKLNTENDAAASAEYEYQSLLIQSADKQLDVELKQVETQQKACENEIDSVKKILDKNIEKSFKVFG